MNTSRAPAGLRRRARAELDNDELPTFLFYAFAAILVFAALRVVTARNPVHAVLWLVLAFFTAAAHWLMLRAEFLAIVLVLVYVGAVMVLFLFVVMMLDINFDSLRKEFRSYIPVGATVGVLVLVEMALTLVGGTLGVAAPGGGTRRRGQQHQGARLAGLHPIRLSVRDRRRDPAGRDHRGDRVDAPEAQGVEVPGSERAGEGASAGPPPDSQHPVRKTRPINPKSASGPHPCRTFSLCQSFRYLPCRTTSCWGRSCSRSASSGIFLNRKNVIILLMAIELMLLAVNMNFIAFSSFMDDMAGQVFVFFILTVAAAESAIGLAILVLLFRNIGSIDVEDMDHLKG